MSKTIPDDDAIFEYWVKHASPKTAKHFDMSMADVDRAVARVLASRSKASPSQRK